MSLRGKCYRATGALLVAGLAGAGCTPAGTEAEALPPSTPELGVVMSEYRFETEPVAPAGRVVFRVANAGRLDHQLTLIRLSDDFTSTIDAQLRGPDRRVFPTVATLFDRRPGQSGVFATVLTKGRYAMICFITDDHGAHALQGMSAEFRVD